MFSSSWHTIPTEMKLAIVEHLDVKDMRALALTSQHSYAICLPTLFRSITLNSHDQLIQFLQDVPRSYHPYIQHLNVHTKSSAPAVTIQEKTENLMSLLISASRLERLTIHMADSLHKNIIACFPHLQALKDVTLINASDEVAFPLSERLVVGIAASIPNLQSLSIDGVTRSLFHAPELVGVHPYVPLVNGDEDIPDHPILGSDLYLPSLLRIRTLKTLVIRNTHLGDSRWCTTPVMCRLEVLDIGSYCNETEEYNQKCTERIMAAVGPTIGEFSLTTSVSDSIFAKPSDTPLPQLRKLHISPFFPVDSMVDTVTNLAGSPIESLSMQCFEDDVVDVCNALEEFLTLRVKRGPQFYERLARIDVSVTALGDSAPADFSFNVECLEATRRLHAICRDLRLASHVRGMTSTAVALDIAGLPYVSSSPNSVVDGRVRSMSI